MKRELDGFDVAVLAIGQTVGLVGLALIALLFNGCGKPAIVLPPGAVNTQAVNRSSQSITVSLSAIVGMDAVLALVKDSDVKVPASLSVTHANSNGTAVLTFDVVSCYYESVVGYNAYSLDHCDHSATNGSVVAMSAGQKLTLRTNDDDAVTATLTVKEYQ